MVFFDNGEFGDPLDPPKSTPGPGLAHKCIKTAQDTPNDCQRSPSTPQSGPKGFQMTAKWAPRAPKSTQRHPQGSQRRPKGTQGKTKGQDIFTDSRSTAPADVMLNNSMNNYLKHDSEPNSLSDTPWARPGELYYHHIVLLLYNNVK